MKNKVDTTIECICDWIQDNIANEKTEGNAIEITETIKALAELASARALLD